MAHNPGQIMKHKSVGSSTDRVQVPVQPELRRALREEPERFGLKESASEAAKLAKLVEVGAAALEEQHQRDIRLEVYAAWSDDPERAAVAEANFDYSMAEGLL